MVARRRQRILAAQTSSEGEERKQFTAVLGRSEEQLLLLLRDCEQFIGYLCVQSVC